MKSLRVVISLITIFLLASSAAYGAANRTWVSHTGKDSNACTVTSPCLTFAGAYAKTNAGGEIDALDAGDFGPLNITKAITIDGGNSQLATVFQQTSAWYGIYIDAGVADTVTLRNLSIHGTWPTPTKTGSAGIDITSAQTVHIEHCIVSGFLTGISILPGSTLYAYVDDTVARDNSVNIELGSDTVANISHSHFSGGTTAFGIYIAGSNVHAMISDVESSGNQEGLYMNTGEGGPFSAVFISNSVFAYNSDYGVVANGPGAVVTLSNTAIVDNTNGGISYVNGATVSSFGNNPDNGYGAPSGTILLQ